jgi:TPR repeat protein
VPRDRAEALAWYDKAAALGLEEAHEAASWLKVGDAVASLWWLWLLLLAGTVGAFISLRLLAGEFGRKRLWFACLALLAAAAVLLLSFAPGGLSAPF